MSTLEQRKDMQSILVPLAAVCGAAGLFDEIVAGSLPDDFVPPALTGEELAGKVLEAIDGDEWILCDHAPHLADEEALNVAVDVLLAALENPTEPICTFLERHYERWNRTPLLYYDEGDGKYEFVWFTLGMMLVNCVLGIEDWHLLPEYATATPADDTTASAESH